MGAAPPYGNSYWVINELLLSEMKNPAYEMIQNFTHLVNRYGFVPNGGRISYERLSRPRFLLMRSCYQATRIKFLRAALPSLEGENQFWMQTAVALNGTEHRLKRFDVQVGVSRPGSHTGDLELAEGLAEEQLWMDLKAGAESGWDFTSRWYGDGEGHDDAPSDTRTSQILPADLHALLCLNKHALAALLQEQPLTLELTFASRNKRRWRQMRDAVRGRWFDYSLVTRSRHLELHPSNLPPLWARCYSQPEMGDEAVHKAVRYLKGSGALQFRGVPTSLRAGQLWDYPNAWPPLQHVLNELRSVALPRPDEYGATLQGGRRVSSDLLLPLVATVAIPLRWI
ncbi:LOW QUALITY PROTEIN: trehalase [Xenentodon cancila]